MEHSITKYISENLPHKSRYEIDLSLLRDGHEPEQIEAVWEQFAPVSAKIIRGWHIPKILVSVEIWAFLSSVGFLSFVIGPLLVPKFNRAKKLWNKALFTRFSQRGRYLFPGNFDLLRLVSRS